MSVTAGRGLMARVLLPVLVLASCSQPEEPVPGPNETIRIVFKHQPIHGDVAPFQQLLEEFEAGYPRARVRVDSEVLLSDTDLQHQFYVTNLEGGSRDFDLLSVDVIWVPEFARAGWLLDLSGWLPPERVRQEFFAGPAESVTWSGKTWAVPWFIEAGLLYYRQDLLDKYGLGPPRSYTELAASARKVLDGERQRGLKGFVWQGRQYEGLVCTALEVIHGFGGSILDDRGRVVLDHREAVQGVAYLRRLIEQGVSPPLTTSADEEVARNLFNDGHAVFMRNWPYALSLLEREGSPVRGRVGFIPPPAEPGGRGGGTLGGWQLAVNRRTPRWKREHVWALVEYLSSPEVQRRMLRAYSMSPTRLSLYRDPIFRREAPLAAALQPALESARPRPVTPFYLMISQVLQGELSAAVAGILPPDRAMQRAAAQVRLIIGDRGDRGDRADRGDRGQGERP